jgi:hypothetical protein
MMAQPEHQRSAGETLRAVREQVADYDPVDKLLQLQRELLSLEQRYGLSSSEFYRRYQAGEMGDDVEIVGWAGRYRAFVELRSSIADSLNQVIVLPIPALA